MKACPQCHLRYPNESTACFVDGVALESISDPRIGTTIAGRYVIEEVIGEGGMATVYRARHKLVDRPCAVKIMTPTLAKDQVVRERFRREAKAAQRLAHPNIIEIFDHGDTEDGTSFLVMEMLEGEALIEVTQKGQVPLPRALPIMIQIARALSRAHDFEVIHRDLKPENIFLAKTEAGEEIVKLLDFGIARSMQDTRLTGVGEVFGTPQYMAPERITSIDAGPAADLYALGVIFFEMLTGRLPFDAADIPTFFVKHLREAPPKVRSINPAIPATLESLVDRLLAKEPKGRPVDAHRVHADLVSISREVGIAVPPEPTTVSLASSSKPLTLQPVAIDRWAQRTAVFEQMLERAFGPSVPADMRLLLEEVRQMVTLITGVRQSGLAEQRKLEAIEQKGREGRQRFGTAMDALGLDASSARESEREALATLNELVEATARCGAAVTMAHREVIIWEGRSGFAEPYAQLAVAYRTMAELVDQWLTARKADRAAHADKETKARLVADLEFQIAELRGASGKFVQNVEAEKAATEATIAELGRRADLMEAELLSLSTRLCAPLRGRPELGPLFVELEGSAAA